MVGYVTEDNEIVKVVYYKKTTDSRENAMKTTSGNKLLDLCTPLSFCWDEPNRTHFSKRMHSRAPSKLFTSVPNTSGGIIDMQVKTMSLILS